MDGYEFQILKSNESNDLWDRAIKSIPSANFFHTSDWLHFLESHFKTDLKKIFIYDSNKLAGIFPIFEKEYGFLKIAGSPLHAENNPYMGFAIKDDENTSLLFYAINQFVKEQGISFFRASFDSTVYEKEFQAYGYVLEKKETYLLDLSVDEEQLWKGIGQKGRNKVRKSKNNNITFSVATGSGFADSYFEMSKNVYAHQGLPPLLQKSYYDELFAILEKKDFARVYVAKSPDETPVAAAIIIIYQDKAYYLDGVSLKEYQSLGVNNHLQWNIINSLKEMGVVHYDLIGAGGLSGIEQFKKSFGTTVFPTLYVEKSFSGLSKVARDLYVKKKMIKKKIDFYMQR